MSAVLIKALTERQSTYRGALAHLVSLADDEHENAASRQAETLREAVELVGCLRRLLVGRSVAEVHRAFGAPGDFGYDTPIGDALSALYRDAAKAGAP